MDLALNSPWSTKKSILETFTGVVWMDRDKDGLIWDSGEREKMRMLPRSGKSSLALNCDTLRSRNFSRRLQKSTGEILWQEVIRFSWERNARGPDSTTCTQGLSEFSWPAEGSGVNWWGVSGKSVKISNSTRHDTFAQIHNAPNNFLLKRTLPYPSRDHAHNP